MALNRSLTVTPTMFANTTTIFNMNGSSSNPTESQHCGEYLYDFHKDIALSAVFGSCFFVGLIMIFAGYRFFRFTLFIQPFSLTAVIIYQVIVGYVGLTALYSGLAAAGGGVAFGLIATFVNTIGLFGISLVQGVFVGTCILYVVNIFIEITNAFIAPAVILVCFVFLALPAIKYEKISIIAYSASYGTALIMLIIDYFLNLSMLRKLAYQLLVYKQRRDTTKPCWFSWILFGLWPILVILGCLVQTLKTGRYYEHKDHQCCKRRKREPSVHLLSSKNDVISKTWIYGPSTPPTKAERDDEVYLMEDMTAI